MKKIFVWGFLIVFGLTFASPVFAMGRRADHDDEFSPTTGTGAATSAGSAGGTPSTQTASGNVGRW